MTEYEFTEDENKVFTMLTQNMLLASALLCLSGIIAIVLGIVESSLFDLISGAVVLSIGISLYFPTDNFKRIVSTTGDDIKELLQGFAELDLGWLIVNIISGIYMLVKIVRIFVNF